MATQQTGNKISIENGKLVVPDQPTIPFVIGDGTGPDIWKSSVRVLDAAVAKAYDGKRKIDWLEVYAGELAFKKFNNWLPDEPPAVNDFAVPVPRTAYVSVEVSEIFAMANSGVISPQSASLEDIAENPAQVSDLLSKLNFMPSSSLLQKFRTAPVSEQRRVVRQLRNTPAASRLKSKVKQMGLSPQEIQRIRSLAQ